MRPIKDCIKRTVCYVDPVTGLVESSYKRQKTSVILKPGEAVTFEREQIRTIVTRTTTDFDVDSRRIAA